VPTRTPATTRTVGGHHGSAAFAYEVPARGGATGPPPPPVIASGGMAGWQITLIAVGAALFASVLAVLADRSRAARRQHSATSA
jgi:hypothetical protein